MQIRPIPFDSEDYRAACALREAVLRRPIGLALRSEDVAQDHARLHWGAWEKDELLGCISLVRHEDHAQIKQMAVRASAQGKGIGAQLVRAAEDWARAHGYNRMELCARETAIPFYEKSGYRVTSDIFIDVLLPHRTMEKHLR